MPKYKWDNVYEWLEEVSKEWSLQQLRADFMGLACKVDPDTLHDIFQSDMDKDGYFEDKEV